MQNLSDTQIQIVSEIGTAVSRLGGNSGLLSIIMSWGDTMDDQSTLDCIKDYNRITEPQNIEGSK